MRIKWQQHYVSRNYGGSSQKCMRKPSRKGFCINSYMMRITVFVCVCSYNCIRNIPVSFKTEPSLLWFEVTVYTMMHQHSPRYVRTLRAFPYHIHMFYNEIMVQMMYIVACMLVAELSAYIYMYMYTVWVYVHVYCMSSKFCLSLVPNIDLFGLSTSAGIRSVLP